MNWFRRKPKKVLVYNPIHLKAGTEIILKETNLDIVLDTSLDKGFEVRDIE